MSPLLIHVCAESDLGVLVAGSFNPSVLCIGVNNRARHILPSIRRSCEQL